MAGCWPGHRGMGPHCACAPAACLLPLHSYGVPHDATGTFVGETADTFRNIRGPVHLFDPKLERLQVGSS